MLRDIVSMRLTCDGICNDRLIANLQRNILEKGF